MKASLAAFACIAMLACQSALAQTAPATGPATAPAAPPVEDFKPSVLNKPGQQYPQVNSEGYIRFRISAPNAKAVRAEVGGTVLTKDANGAWVGTTARPQPEGFHYYQINIDGVSQPDPGTMTFYGSSRWGSAVEVPAKDKDFYALKNVPHGRLSDVYFFSKVSNAESHCYVYTPPDYDKDPGKRYPVLYLQHGAGEDEHGWAQQGYANLIMDNLIAEGKAKPFIIVIANSSVGGGGGGGGRGGAPGDAPGGRGGAPGGGPAGALGPAADGLFYAGAPAAGAGGAGGAPGAGPGGRRGAGRGAPGGRGGPGGGPGGGGGFGPFEQYLLTDLIPYIDGNFHTIADQPHRAMAGLSMGGMQTKSITLLHLDTFSHIGIFSGGNIMPADITDMAAFKQKVKVVFMSYGSMEPSTARGGAPGGPEGAKAAADALNAAGIKAVSYVSPGTQHEWMSWRRSLHEFAPLLFQD